MLKSSAEPAANGLSPAGGAGLGAPNKPPLGTPNGDAGATEPNALSVGVGTVPNIDVVELPNKLLADGAAAPNTDELPLVGAPNGLAVDVDPKIEDEPEAAEADDPNIEDDAGGAAVVEAPNIKDAGGAAVVFDPNIDDAGGASVVDDPKIEDVGGTAVLDPNNEDPVGAAVVDDPKVVVDWVELPKTEVGVSAGFDGTAPDVPNMEVPPIGGAGEAGGVVPNTNIPAGSDLGAPKIEETGCSCFSVELNIEDDDCSGGAPNIEVLVPDEPKRDDCIIG